MTTPVEIEGSGALAWRELPPSLARIRALRCLVAVFEAGSTLRAAEAVHLSQPAVARAILDLERSLGMPLFERGARGMVPTVPGAAAARRAALVFSHLEDGAREAHALAPARFRRARVAGRFARGVTFPSLRALLAVASTGSEAGAARLAGLSQPSVHRALRALEDLSGAPLFLKSGRGTRLGEAGEALLRHAKLAAAQARALESDIAAWRGELHGRVVVGALPLSVGLLLPRAVEALLGDHPEVEVTVVDGTYESLMRQLRSADVDLIVGALRPGAPADVRQEALFEDDLVVVARPGHPCLASRSPKARDLLRWPWILPLPGTPGRAALERAFEALGLPLPPDTLSANSPGFTHALIARTDRLALASRSQALQDERAGRLRILPVPLPGTTRAIGLTVRAIGEPSPDLAALVARLREAASGRQPRPAGESRPQRAGT